MEKNPIHKIGAVGIPNIDFHLPKLALLNDALASLENDPNHIIAGENLDDITTLKSALHFRHEIYDYLDVDYRGGIKEGAKDDVTPGGIELFAKSEPLFLAAAEVINRRLSPSPPVELRFLGGCSTNKLNGYKAGLGGNIDARLIGVVGNDENGQFIKENLKNRGITLLDNGATCDKTPVNFIITEDREGSPTGDRHILKGPSTANETLKNNEDFILSEVGQLNRLFLEGGEINRSKFGPALFEKILDAAIHSNINMAYSPCTSIEVKQQYPGNAAILDKARFYRNNNLPTVLNVEELLANYLPEGILPEGYKRDKSPDNMRSPDPHLSLALQNLKDELRQRTQDSPDPENQAIAIVSDSVRGVFIMTEKPEQTRFVKPLAGNKITVVDTTGAGDNLAAGACIKTIELTNAYRDSNAPVVFTDTDLDNIAECGQAVAQVAIQQYGGAADQDKILRAFKAQSAAPKAGSLVGAEQCSLPHQQLAI